MFSALRGLDAHGEVTVDTFTNVTPKLRHYSEFTEQFRHRKVYALTRHTGRLHRAGHPPLVKKWGSRLGNSAVIQHKGRHYLEVFQVSSERQQYLWEDGSRLTVREVHQLERKFLPRRKPQKLNEDSHLHFKIESISQFQGFGLTIRQEVNFG